jgi:hypothetical protein
MPVLYLLLIIASILVPGFFVLLGHYAAVLLGVAGRIGARRIPAGAKLRICPRRPGARRVQPDHHVAHLLPNAMVATLTFLPFILVGSITTLTSLDFLGFGLPPGSPSLANCWRRASQSAGAVARPDRLLRHLAMMLSLLIFIGEACAMPSIPARRSDEMVGQDHDSRMPWTSQPLLLSVERPLRRTSTRASTRTIAVDRCRSTIGRARRRAGGRIRLRQVRDGALDPEAAALPFGASIPPAGSCSRARTC